MPLSRFSLVVAAPELPSSRVEDIERSVLLAQLAASEAQEWHEAGPWLADFQSRLAGLAWAKAEDAVEGWHRPAAKGTAPRDAIGSALRAWAGGGDPPAGDPVVDRFGRAWDAVTEAAGRGHALARAFLGMAGPDDHTAVRNRLVCYARVGKRGTELAVVLLSVAYPGGPLPDLTEPFGGAGVWAQRWVGHLVEDRFVRKVRSKVPGWMGATGTAIDPVPVPRAGGTSTVTSFRSPPGHATGW